MSKGILLTSKEALEIKGLTDDEVQEKIISLIRALGNRRTYSKRTSIESIHINWVDIDNENTKQSVIKEYSFSIRYKA